NIQYHKRMEAQRFLAQEIEIAAEIQRKILPSIPSQVHSHRMAAFNRPAKEVGGDFYDFFRFDESKYAVLVGDVSGKGIPAALFMNSARNIIRAEMRMNNQPGRLLSHSNLYIYEESEYGMFVTLFYALVDAHNNVITFGSAGHNDQLLIRKKAGRVDRLNARGGPLGLRESAVFEERVITFEKDDLLLLFTDGVIDFFGEGHIDKGEEQLLHICRDYIDRDPSELTEHLQGLLAAGAADSYFLDDFTILPILF
ncbi:MAG TPA: serine/threonine-protein phosphatase, partial [Spirochaetes bacterium]|nr:serine/threonine-protein phosphatase [Spirochaetota bacterium]